VRRLKLGQLEVGQMSPRPHPDCGQPLPKQTPTMPQQHQQRQRRRQVEAVCAELKAMPELEGGFNAVGFSQGGQFLRVGRAVGGGPILGWGQRARVDWLSVGSL